MKTYCTSFYGSVLWDLIHPVISTLCITWRKGLRRILGVFHIVHIVLSFVTYNMHGFRQGHEYLVNLCSDHNVVLIQEHWLAQFDLYKLDNVCNNMTCFSSSAMDQAIFHGCLKRKTFCFWGCRHLC